MRLKENVRKALRKQGFSRFGRERAKSMRNVYDCVEAFEKLLDKEYQIVLGRKNVAVNIQINFDRKECFHLMGFQYLTDRPELVHDRGKIFDAIKERRITVEQIQSSDLYYKIADRVNMLPLMEDMLDSNDTVFKYNQKLNAYSVIKADYVMKNKMDYTKNQTSWTLLYKKKITLSTGEEEILYDRLKRE